tara:strand:+ start:5168 stop:6049 length:882 start_codon:yes stop_codon:yes gene_type:complete
MNEEMRKAVDALYFGKTDLPPEEQMKNLGGILSILAPDPDDPLEYLGGPVSFVGKRVNAFRKLAGGSDNETLSEVRRIADEIAEEGSPEELQQVLKELDEIEFAGKNKIARDSDPNMPITEQYAEGSNMVMNVKRFREPIENRLKKEGQGSDLTRKQQREKVKELQKKYGGGGKPEKTYPDIRKKEVLGANRASKILEEHGYKELDEVEDALSLMSKDELRKGDFKGRRYEVIGDDVKIYTELSPSGTEVEVLKNPTLQELMDFLGYKKGGLVQGMKAGGEVMNYGDYGRSYK